MAPKKNKSLQRIEPQRSYPRRHDGYRWTRKNLFESLGTFDVIKKK